MKKEAKEKIDVVKLLSEGRSVEIPPQGYSMYPLLIPGRDRVVISPFVRQKDKAKRGDVLLYRRVSENILVLHRVYKVNDGGVFFVGDNQTDIEGPVSYRYVLGRATEFVRKGHRFSADNIIYRVLFGIWLMMRPVRKPVSEFVHKIRVIIKK